MRRPAPAPAVRLVGAGGREGGEAVLLETRVVAVIGGAAMEEAVEQQASKGQVPAYEATVVANTRDA